MFVIDDDNHNNNDDINNDEDLDDNDYDNDDDDDDQDDSLPGLVLMSGVAVGCFREPDIPVRGVWGAAQVESGSETSPDLRLPQVPELPYENDPRYVTGQVRRQRWQKVSCHLGGLFFFFSFEFVCVCVCVCVCVGGGVREGAGLAVRKFLFFVRFFFVCVCVCVW